MTLDEAIKYVENAAGKAHGKFGKECNMQIAEWLKELKRYKDKEFASVIDRMSMKSKKWTFKIRYYVSDSDANDVYFEQKNDVIEEYAPTEIDAYNMLIRECVRNGHSDFTVDSLCSKDIS